MAGEAAATAVAAGTKTGKKRKRGRGARVMEVMAGHSLVEAREMADASPLLRRGDVAELRRLLARDGFLFLRGFLERPGVLAARAHVLAALAEARPGLFSPSGAEEGLLAPGTKAVGLLERQDIAQMAPVKAVLEASELFGLMAALSDADEGGVITTRYKWLRAVATGEFTGVHTDRVFLGRGSERLLTAWLPLGDIATANGGLAVCRGSNRLRSFAPLRRSYGATQVGKDGTASGWLSDKGSDVALAVGGPASPDWRTADFRAGDAVVLALDTLHMSLQNVTDCLRVSCDTRWQPSADSRDPRLRDWAAAGGEPVGGGAMR